MHGALCSLVPFVSMINQSTFYSSISECCSKIQHKNTKKRLDIQQIQQVSSISSVYINKNIHINAYIYIHISTHYFSNICTGMEE